MELFRFCPSCGSALQPPAEPPERVLMQMCSRCGAVHFRNAKPCAGVLVVRDGKVLLGRRALDPARGTWDIPGGFLEPWEHPVVGAAREVAEETGLIVEPKELLAMLVDTYQDRWYTLNIYYLAEPIGGHERAADDLTELGWFRPDELPGDYSFENTREALTLWAQRLSF